MSVHENHMWTAIDEKNMEAILVVMNIIQVVVSNYKAWRKPT